VAELPGMIFYQQEPLGGLAVNLYTPATAEVELAGGVSLKIRQDTDYPRSGRVVIHLDPSQPARFPLSLRIPRWCQGASAQVNGQPVSQPVEPGRFLSIDRRWQAGDQVLLDMPMPLRLVKGRKAQANRVAVMRGPVLFGLNRARNAELGDMNLRLLVVDPDSLEEPCADDSVHPWGQALHLRAWSFDRNYPVLPANLSVALTDFPDPGIEAVYFKVPNPNANAFVDDELLHSSEH
jgi:hypothetical protein